MVGRTCLPAGLAFIRLPAANGDYVHIRFHRVSYFPIRDAVISIPPKAGDKSHDLHCLFNLEAKLWALPADY